MRRFASVVTLLVFSGVVHAQTLKPGAAPQTMACDGAAITSATAREVGGDSNVMVGSYADLYMAVRNSCASALTVHYRMRVNNTVVREGDAYINGGGGYVNISLVPGYRTTTVGDFVMTGEVSAPNDSNTANNTVSVPFKVVPQTKVTKVLEAKPATEASFLSNPDPGPQCSLQSFGSTSTFDKSVFASVVFQMSCAGQFIGGKASPEAFVNFLLKNGWQVYSFSRNGSPAPCEGLSTGDCSAQFITAPQVGSNNPYTKMRLWANGGHTVTYPLIITIWGPRNTDPYKCQLGFFDCSMGVPLRERGAFAPRSRDAGTQGLAPFCRADS